MNADFVRQMIDFDLQRARDLLQNSARFGMTTSSLELYHPVTDVMRRLYQQLDLLERGVLETEGFIATVRDCGQLMDEADARLWELVDRNNPRWQAAKVAAQHSPTPIEIER